MVWQSYVQNLLGIRAEKKSTITLLTILFSSCLIITTLFIFIWRIPYRMVARGEYLMHNLPYSKQNHHYYSYIDETPSEVIPQQYLPLPSLSLEPLPKSKYQHERFTLPPLDRIQLFPTEAFKIEEMITPHNIALQPLPPNPNNYKYFIIRRMVSVVPEAFHKIIEYGDPFHSYIWTCYSDWFPLHLIQEQDQERRDWAQKQPIYVDVGQRNGLEYELLDEELEYNHRYPINMSRVDKHALAEAYGYDNYDDMPLHPRIPLDNKYNNNKSNKYNIQWTHRCITPWKKDEHSQQKDPNYFRAYLGLRGAQYTGAEDARTWYDRCGRMSLVYGSWNDQTPILPDWGLKYTDARYMDPNGLQFRQLDECPIKYWAPQLTHTIDNIDGHINFREKNHLELPYGFGNNNMNALSLLRQLMISNANYYDYKTNSLYFDRKTYKILLDTRRQNEQIQNFLHESPTFITNVYPIAYQTGTIQRKEIGTKVLQKCLSDYSKHRHDELPWDFTHNWNFHSATNYILIYISDNDWDSFDINSKHRTNWVYMAIGHDRSTFTPKVHAQIYRPIILLFDANTMDLIAIRPANFNTHDKCRDGPSSCRYGLGIDCVAHCRLTYVHHLFSTETPLTYSLFEGPQNITQVPRFPEMRKKTYRKIKETWAILQSFQPREYDLYPQVTNNPYFHPYSPQKPPLFANPGIEPINNDELDLKHNQKYNAYTKKVHRFQYEVRSDLNPKLQWALLNNPNNVELTPELESLAERTILINHYIQRREEYNGNKTAITISLQEQQQRYIKIIQQLQNQRQNDLVSKGYNESQDNFSFPATIQQRIQHLDDFIKQERLIESTSLNEKDIIKSTLHTILPSYYTLDSQIFASLNIDDKYNWFQEIDLRAVWNLRYSCPKPTPKLTITDNLRTDPVYLHFAHQQRPHFLINLYWTQSLLEFYNWDIHYSRLSIIFFILVIIFIITGIITHSMFHRRLITWSNQPYTLLPQQMLQVDGFDDDEDDNTNIGNSNNNHNQFPQPDSFMDDDDDDDEDNFTNNNSQQSNDITDDHPSTP